ncbi:MAG: tRNA (N6-isopentenyl adenosine(37)-C2)-methylthiotransferase MiaB [Gammaproteobacteria bacterium]|nr:tRNA (N6-isopentenyl adenosine(37)-C2)-methylthiotransferase MiaB [Gammaproteobacteria bacterium]
MAGRLHITTLGCQMNEYDSGRMADLLRSESGLETTADPEQADVLLLNTCSVREKAQEKVFSLLGRWRRLKQRRPDLVIGVGGCVASQEGEAILQRAPFVDLVFGPQTIHRLPGMIEQLRASGRAQVDVSFPEIEKFDRLPEPRVAGAAAFVSIMEGCSRFCSYCIVPFTRGAEISRPFAQVLAEVEGLLDGGVREVTLLGQNVNAWRGALPGGGHGDLATLIRHLARLNGLERLRFTTSHPLEFGDALIDAYAEVPQLADYLHLPVQSGSDRILALMQRGYTRLEYRHKVRRLRAVRPQLSLSSDFIVGFPGETEADFRQTLELIAEVGFDQSFSFVYSARPGTPAANLPDVVPRELALERLARLQERVDGQARTISAAMVGSVQRVLVERPARRNPRQLAGRTSNMRWVNFDGPAGLVHRFVDVHITEALPNSLRGRLVA